MKKKRVFRLFLVTALMAVMGGLAATNVWAAGAEAENYDISYGSGSLKSEATSTESVTYRDRQWDPKIRKIVYTDTTADCRRLDAESAARLQAGWYFVKGELKIGDIKPEVVGDTVNIILCDESKLICEEGIYVPEGHTLNIYGQTNDKSRYWGELETYGDGNGSAGIGGAAGKACGNINIYGAIITAQGDPNAAGIGGSDGAAGGNVTIYGGLLEAKGGQGAAGIGGGNNGDGGNFTVYGGDAYGYGCVNGTSGGAGIGGGNHGDGGNTKIFGGIVGGTGGSKAAGIGGGSNASGGKITISGGMVIPSGGPGGAGIGGGYKGEAGDVTITSGTVMTSGGTNAAGIGSGDGGQGGTIVIEKGSVLAIGSNNGAGIGSGSGGSFGKILISGGTVGADGGDYATGIGTGKITNARQRGTIEISGGEVTARGGKDGAGIGGSKDVETSISGGTVSAYGGTNGTTGGAGIGGANTASGGVINVSGKANIKEAKGGQNAAGIGGGSGANIGDVRVTGGTINAAATGNGAGIGGGEKCRNGSITISAGQIKATGAGGGAGIGGGRYGASGAVRIYDGTITANGGDRGGAGIGTGASCYKNKCDVTISGGTVKAYGSESYTEIDNAIGNGLKYHTYEGAGIGAGGIRARASRTGSSPDQWGEEVIIGYSYFSGRISITGSTVHTNMIGTSTDKALDDYSPGTIEFGGGTVEVRKSLVKDVKVEFADDVWVVGVSPDKREERCKQNESFLVETCPHNRQHYMVVDENSHRWGCDYCMAPFEGRSAHDYGEPVWNWDESGTAVSATFVCRLCLHKETVPAETTQSGSLHAASEDSGTTAKVIFGGRTYTDEKNKTEYAIALDEVKNGSLDVPTSANVGAEVTITATADDHYHVSSVTLNGQPLEVKDGSCTFKMPKGDVKVGAEFEIDSVQLTWVSRDYVYDYEKNEYTDETVDTVVYKEEVPYGTEAELPSAEEFAAMSGYCGIDKWEVAKNGETAEMKPGEKAVANGDVTLTAIWREHNFAYSVSDDGATITATCSHETCALTDGKISLTIRKPAVNTYGDTEKGFAANATLTLDGLDAFMEYARELQAFAEYGEGMDASEKYAEIKEYYDAHPDEYAQYAEDIDAYLKELEDSVALVDGWADKYIKYYRAEIDSDGVYVKTGSALKAPPTEAGDYVAELQSDSEEIGIDKKIFVGYTIGKADPLYEVPEDLSAEFGEKLSGVRFSEAADGAWSWNDGEKKVSKLDVYKGMATFAPDDTENYNAMTHVRVPVKVTITTETNIADKALVDAAYDAVMVVQKTPTKGTVKAAQAALAKIKTENQKAMYGASELARDLEALETAQKKLVKTVTVNTKTVTAKAVNKATAKAGGDADYVTKIVLGKKVKKISKGAFRNYKKAGTLVVKTRMLSKGTVKQSLKGSKITKVKVQVGKKKVNWKYVKKYKKIFTKKIVGKKVKVSL